MKFRNLSVFLFFLLFGFLSIILSKNISYAVEFCTDSICDTEKTDYSYLGPGESCQPGWVNGEYGDTMCCRGDGCQTHACSTFMEGQRCIPENLPPWSCCGWEAIGDGMTSSQCDAACDRTYRLFNGLCLCNSCDPSFICGQALQTGICWTSSQCPSGGGSGGGSSCSQSPSSVSLVAPASGAQFTDTSPLTLDWNATPDWGGSDCTVRNYRLQVDNTNNTFPSPELERTYGENTTIDTNITLPCTSNYATYYWRVRAENENGNSAWSAVRSFQYRCYPPSGVLYSPAEGAVYTTNTNIYYHTVASDGSTIDGKKLQRTDGHFRWDHDADNNFNEGIPNGSDGGWISSTANPTGNFCGDNQSCTVGPGPNPPATVERVINIPHAKEGYYQATMNALSYRDVGVGCITGDPTCKCTGNPDGVSPLDWSDCNSSGEDENKFHVLAYPTGVMNSPANNSTYNEGNTIAISATGTDTSGEFNIMRLYVIEDLGGGLYGTPTMLIDKLSCNTEGTNCSLSTTYTVPANYAGKKLVFYMQAVDTPYNGEGDRCSGRPDGEPGLWQDCGPNSRVTVTIANNVPVCTSLDGVSSLNANEYGYYNARGYDLNYTGLNKTWRTAVGSACTLQVDTIQRIVVRAKGTQNGVGQWPVMEISTGNLTNGSRTTESSCTRTVNSGVWDNYECILNKAVGSIYIDYVNDSTTGGVDQNLHVDQVTLFIDDGSGNITEKIVDSNSKNANGDYVIYDGEYPNYTPGADPSHYDGNTIRSLVEYPLGSGQYISMNWGGSLHIPIPIKFTGTAPCTLQASLSDGTDTGTCNKDIGLCGRNPEVPTLLSPIDNVTEQPINLDLTWQEIADWGEVCTGFNRSIDVYVKTPGTFCDEDDYDGYGLWQSIDVEEQGNLTSHNVTLTRNTWHCWYIEASNGEFSSRSVVKSFQTANPALDQEWLTTIGGALFARDIDMGLPSEADFAPGWNFPHPFLSYNPLSILFSNEDPYIEIPFTPQAGGVLSQSGTWATSLDITNLWPINYTGALPIIDPVPISGSDCLDFYNNPEILLPGGVYSMEASCLNNALENMVNTSDSTYSLQDDGIAVIYVTGNATVTFGENNIGFVSDRPSSRILFVFGRDVGVTISRDLRVATPNLVTLPQIEAGFVFTSQSKPFSVPGVAEGKEGDDPDSTVVLEGPIIARTSQFNRNRGDSNGYPSEIIRYNPYYMYELTREERNSTEVNRTGLFTVSIDRWEIVK